MDLGSKMLSWLINKFSGIKVDLMAMNSALKLQWEINNEETEFLNINFIGTSP